MPCNQNICLVRELEIISRLSALWKTNSFVPDRQIQDNILIAHEVFHYRRLKRRSNCFELGFKLDMNKAYDRVEWDFVEENLMRMGFNPRWVRLVMSCITTASLSLVINGFNPTRGLRQGDPLFPYLFLLVSEVLSRSVTYANLSRSGPLISHILFADDSLFF